MNSVAPTGVGGEPLKALLLRNDGFSGADAAAAVVVSRTAVTVTQSLLVVAGLTALLGRFHTGWATVSLVLLLAVAAAFFLLLVRLQRSGPMQLGTRVLGGVFPQSRLVAKFEDRAVAGDARLTTFYRSERATFVGAGCWHMLSWLACAAEVWLLLRLMGAAISCGDALIIEGLAQPIRAAAIIVPGALGVQESGGVAVCSWLGIGLDVSVAVWLVRRAREPVGSTGCPSWKNARRGALAAAEVAPQRAAIYPTLTVRSRPGGSVRPAPEQDRPPSAAGGAS